MYVLTVAARMRTAEALREHVLRWSVDVGPVGWLGNTAGVSTDGDFILLMRFESKEAAWITSDIPEYGRWWRDCGEHLDTEPVFDGSTDVTGILSGGSDQAAAVRITRGHTAPGRLRESLRRLETLALNKRAGVIGGIVAWHEHERFTEALYLTSKELVAVGQQATEAPPLRRFVDDHEASIVEATVIDLDDPWLTSPREAQ